MPMSAAGSSLASLGCWAWKSSPPDSAKSCSPPGGGPLFQRMAQQDPVVPGVQPISTGPTPGCSISSSTCSTGPRPPRSSWLALTRPELYERRPGWGSGVRSATSAGGLSAAARPGHARAALTAWPAGLPESSVTGGLRARGRNSPVRRRDGPGCSSTRGQLVPAGDGFALAEERDAARPAGGARDPARPHRGAPGREQAPRTGLLISDAAVPCPELHDYRPR